jgi:hypothetical protein
MPTFKIWRTFLDEVIEDQAYQCAAVNLKFFNLLIVVTYWPQWEFGYARIT